MSFDRPGLRGVHLVVEGECELVLGDRAVQPLGAGDLVILPRGDAHVLPGTSWPAPPESRRTD